MLRADVEVGESKHFPDEICAYDPVLLLQISKVLRVSSKTVNMGGEFYINQSDPIFCSIFILFGYYATQINIKNKTKDKKDCFS